jgi:hypothetical protein
LKPRACRRRDAAISARFERGPIEDARRQRYPAQNQEQERRLLAPVIARAAARFSPVALTSDASP